ncbi:MAG TPA: NrfD/PsrC family molybdoenzyme membrane anchor subunit [Opitutaceae bacterium]|nr:NrfD/PsrC family molybdoenzyme membrane anchor subunit [Opitutaceae bacterium]
MIATPQNHPDNFEERLHQLREEALAKGVVTGAGVHAAAGPMPEPTRTPETLNTVGYYGLPIIKPPVWKWMIGGYFFVGGLSGMASLLAAAALLKRDWAMSRAAMWCAAAGAVVSPALLIWDLGRPQRFINMLRVFKPQSPMSLGSWVLTAFGAAAIPGAVLTELQFRMLERGTPNAAIHGLAIAAIVGSASTGVLLATYTGALLGVTAVPAWHLHRKVLPFHFGIAGLGSAAALLELLGFRSPALRLIGYGAAALETAVLVTLETRKHAEADEALHKGKSGLTLRSGEALEGPLSLVFRAFGASPQAAGCFLAGALLTRFGWLSAGRESAKNPRAVLASQRPALPAAPSRRQRSIAKPQHQPAESM